MILSSFGFKEILTLYCIFATLFIFSEETHFSILSCLGFIFEGFCSPMRLGILHYFLLLVWETKKGQQRAPINYT